MSYKHLNGVMFDLETAGQKTRDSAVLSFGAVRFNIDTREIYDKVYITVNLKSSLDVGLQYTKSTMEFWKRQPQEVLNSLFIDTKDIRVAMAEIEAWFKKGPKREKVWAWGSHFDAPMLENNMAAVGIEETPWMYWEVKDARTVKDVFQVDITRTDGAHNALVDAIDQAKYLIDLFNPEEV